MSGENVFVDRGLPERERVVLEFLLRAALAVVDADGVSVMLLDREGKAITMKGVADTDKNIESKIGITLKLGERVAGKVAQTGETIIIIGDVHTYKRFADLKKYQEIKSGMSAPLKAGSKILGVVNIKRTENAEPIGQAEVKLMNALASVAARLLS